MFLLTLIPFILFTFLFVKKNMTYFDNKIVYLGWGSLIFSPENLPIKKWRLSSLSLPLEYSRISDKGKGRLTLVIDEENGSDNYIWYTNSTEMNIDRAIGKLRVREKTVKQFIGYINRKNGKMRVGNLSDKLIEKIRLWMESMNIDVVIWTNLVSNFGDITSKNYTLDNAMKYFISSNISTQSKITTYIQKCMSICSIKTQFSDYFYNQQ